MSLPLRVLCIAVFLVMMGSVVFADHHEPPVTSSVDGVGSATPVECGNPGAVKPFFVAGKTSPCPGKVYCNNPNTQCGEYCCEWGYFYSNPCTCMCYKSSYDAGAECSTYFRCN